MHFLYSFHHSGFNFVLGGLIGYDSNGSGHGLAHAHINVYKDTNNSEYIFTDLILLVDDNGRWQFKRW